MVELSAPTQAGRLFPKYDNEADLLEVCSRVPRPWPFGVNADSLVIFDIDSDRTLANFDLIIPKRYWPVAKPDERPQVSRKADLVFTKETLEHKNFLLSVYVKTNNDRSLLTIRFGEAEGKAQAVELSEACIALVESNRLVGFFLIL